MEQNYVTVTLCIVRTPYPFVRNLSASATGDATISASDVLVLDVVVRSISISRRSECAAAADRRPSRVARIPLLRYRQTSSSRDSALNRRQSSAIGTFITEHSAREFQRASRGRSY